VKESSGKKDRRKERKERGEMDGSNETKNDINKKLTR
jgi:hypothetical protein